MTLDDFIKKYPPSPPRRQPANLDELRRLDGAAGVDELDRPPARTPHVGRPGQTETCHLWAMLPGSIPYALERPLTVQPALASGVAKHTNLTGGDAASCAGELWVDDMNPSEIYVSGASGRYGPQTPEQLADAVQVLRGRGFIVNSFGWDEDAGVPCRVYRP